MAHKKTHLPSKLCLVCNRPFSWRKSGLELGMKFSIVQKNVKSSVSLRSNMISDLDEAIL